MPTFGATLAEPAPILIHPAVTLSFFATIR